MTNPANDVVTARVVFTGLMLGCINGYFNEQRYEMGMIECPEHYPKIKITRNGFPEPAFDWPPGDDLIISGVNPVQSGVQMHLPNPDRFQQSFALAIDVEAVPLHSGGVNIDPQKLNGRRIGFNAGLFYTSSLSDPLDLYNWSTNPGGAFVEHFGPIAKTTSVNILCPEGESNGVAIINATNGGRLRWLPALPGVTYEIVVDNDCFSTTDGHTPAFPAAGSDFRFLYQVMSPMDTADTRKFDFKRSSSFGVDTPDTCNQNNAGGGGKTLGLDWSKL